MTEAVDADKTLKSHVSLTSMRVFTCGSAPLSPETFRRFREQFGFPIVERYGLTETVINTSNPLRGPWKPGSVGCHSLAWKWDF